MSVQHSPHSPDPDAVMVMGVLLASPNRDQPGALLSAAKAYAALKSSRERVLPPRATNTERSTTGMTTVIEDDSTITVNFMGTFSEKSRPNNGCPDIAEWILSHRHATIPAVVELGFHKYSETETGRVLVLSIKAVEPMVDSDGSDPQGLAAQTRALMDVKRKAKGKGKFEMPAEPDPALFDFDGDGHPVVSEEAETRLGPDGEHEVPPPSAEEELAAREEAKAAGVPAAEFSEVQA